MRGYARIMNVLQGSTAGRRAALAAAPRLLPMVKAAATSNLLLQQRRKQGVQAPSSSTAGPPSQAESREQREQKEQREGSAGVVSSGVDAASSGGVTGNVAGSQPSVPEAEDLGFFMVQALAVNHPSGNTPAIMLIMTDVTA